MAGGAYVPTVFVGMYATRNRLNHLHYSTTNIQEGGIARPSVDGFDSERFRKQWVPTFGELRRKLKFPILGYVLMPAHFQALIWPAAEANPRRSCQRLNYTHNNPVK
jgi:hypothetical protein